MHIQQQSWLHPASLEHPFAHKRRQEYIVYSPGKAAQTGRQFSQFASYRHYSVCHLNTFLLQKLLLFPHMKAASFLPGNILSPLGISWGMFLWLKYSIYFHPSQLLPVTGFWGLSEMSPFPSLITNKNNSLQMLTMKQFLLYWQAKPKEFSILAGMNVLRSKEKAAAEVFPVSSNTKEEQKGNR